MASPYDSECQPEYEICVFVMCSHFSMVLQPLVGEALLAAAMIAAWQSLRDGWASSRLNGVACFCEIPMSRSSLLHVLGQLSSRMDHDVKSYW